MDKILKVVLALILLLCLFDFPYGYYQFVRFASMVGFTFLAFKANEQQQSSGVFIYVALAILFQPYFKIALGRTLWNIVDVIVAVGLIVSLLKTDKHAAKNEK